MTECFGYFSLSSFWKEHEGSSRAILFFVGD